jgi:hypothetical protein
MQTPFSACLHVLMEYVSSNQMKFLSEANLNIHLRQLFLFYSKQIYNVGRATPRASLKSLAKILI